MSTYDSAYSFLKTLVDNLPINIANIGEKISFVPNGDGFQNISEIMGQFITRYPPVSDDFNNFISNTNFRTGEHDYFIYCYNMGIEVPLVRSIPKMRNINGISPFNEYSDEKTKRYCEILASKMLFNSDTSVILQNGALPQKRFGLEQVGEVKDDLKKKHNGRVVVISDEQFLPKIDQRDDQEKYGFKRIDITPDNIESIDFSSQEDLFITSSDINIISALLSSNCRTVTTDSFWMWLTASRKRHLNPNTICEDEILVLNTLYGEEWFVPDSIARHIVSPFVVNEVPNLRNMGTSSKRDRGKAYNKFHGLGSAKQIAAFDMRLLLENI